MNGALFSFLFLAGHNGGQYDVHHGATLGDLWTGNTATGDATAYCGDPHNSSQVVIFEPEPLDM